MEPMAQVLFEPQMNHVVADKVRTGRDSTCDDTNDVRLSVADDTGTDQSSPKLSAKACSKGERPGGPGAFQGCESALFLEPKITSSLCDAVGSEDEKQTRTLTNGKDRHHN